MFNTSLLQSYKRILHGESSEWDGDPNWCHIVVLVPKEWEHDAAVAAANRGFKVIVLPDEALVNANSWGVADLRHPASTLWHTPL